MSLKIEYYRRSVYGNWHIYLMPPLAELVTALTGKATITKNDLAIVATLSGAEPVEILDPRNG